MNEIISQQSKSFLVCLFIVLRTLHLINFSFPPNEGEAVACETHRSSFCSEMQAVSHIWQIGASFCTCWQSRGLAVLQIKNISQALVISSALDTVLGAMTLLSAQSPQRFTTELSQRLSWCEPWGSAFSATRWAGLGDKCCKFLQAVFIFWQFAIHGEQLVLTSYGAASRAGHSQELQHKHCSTLPKHGCINSHRNNLI